MRQILLAVCLGWMFGQAMAIPDPKYALDKRSAAPEVLAVEVKAIQRLGNQSAQAKANCAANPRDCMKPSDWDTEPVQITVLVKSVERSAVGVKQGDELCVAYTTRNPDFKGPMMVGIQYAQMMRVGVAYKVWLAAPASVEQRLSADSGASACFTLAAEWASILKE